MPRAKAILQSEFPYHITGRCINQEWFHLPMPQVWEIFCKELSATIQKRNLLVHNFVLMGNHFHLIASTPNANISQAMHQFMHCSSKELTKAGNRINETFAGRHYKCILQHPNYFLNAYKYVYRNPVNAGASNLVEEYLFSTLQWVTGKAPAKFRLTHDFTFSSDPYGTLQWLNTNPNQEHWESVKLALRRQKFTSKKNRKNGQPIIHQDLVI